MSKVDPGGDGAATASDREHELESHRWRELMMRSPFGIAIYHPDGSLKEVNEQMRRIFELNEKEAELANSAYNILQDQQLDRQGALKYIRRAFSGEAGRLPRVRYHLVTPIAKRKVRKSLQGIIYPIHDRHGGLREVVAIQMDVTDLEKAETAAASGREELSRRLADFRLLELRYRELFENAPLMYAITRASDDGPVIMDCNRLFVKLLGYNKEDLLGLPLQDLYTPHSRYELIENGGYQRALDGLFETSERELVTESGKKITTLLFAAPDRDADGVPVGTRAMYVDISETKKAKQALEDSESKYRSLFEEAMDAVFLTSKDGRWVDANPAAVSLFGFESKDQLLQTRIAADLFQNPDDRDELMRILEKEGSVRDYELLLKDARGRSIIVVESSRVIRGGDGAVLGYHGILHDVTESRQMAKKLEYQAYHDSLTGLPNRAKLHRDFLELVDAENGKSRLAVVLFDLDRFKEVNDALGHQIGDRLLKEIGPRILPPGGASPVLLYRLGGDEFALLISELKDPPEAVRVTCDILEGLKRPVTIDGVTLEIGASAGVAFRPSDGSTSGELLRCADVAMYEAKRTAAGVLRYAREFDPHTVERLQLMAELRKAIAEKKLAVYYQPKVMLKDEQLVGFEALVRWFHPTRGLLAAGDFIPLAEFGDLIHPLTYWVTRMALAQLRRWTRRWPGVTMAVNLSARVLIDRCSARELSRIISEEEVDPTKVEFEVTETALMTDAKVAMATLSELAATGVRIAIDDFGTGYSSLSHLKQGFVRTLKIDRSFVSDMLKNDLSHAIVDATVRMSQDMKLMAVAEGVENEETRRALEGLGCAVAQGYLFSRPAAPEEIEKRLRFSENGPGF